MRPIRLLAAVPAAVLLTVAGCGDDTTAGSGSAASTSSAPASSSASGGVSPLAALTADEILKKATTALKDAGAVRIKGQETSGQGFSIDLRYSDGNSTGTLGVNGQSIELRKIEQTVYLKGSREFWAGNGGEGAAQLLTGKWLKTPLTDKRFSGLSELTDLEEAADGILDPDGTITKGTQKTINGVLSFGLVSSGKDGGTLWVAATGPTYPVRIEPGSASGAKGSVDFTEYGEKTTVEAPPADLVVDVSKLPGGN